MKFEVLILGSLAAMPQRDLITSSQILNVDDHLFLTDCGEGTQMKIEKYKVSRKKIEAVFISHLHGDHVFGLPGLITSMSHHHRTSTLTIIGPKGIEELVLTIMRLSSSYLSFDLKFIEIIEDCFQHVFENEQITVKAFPLKHRITTFGYLFTQKPGRLNIKEELIKKYHLSFEQIRTIKNGGKVTLDNENIYEASFFTYPPVKSKSYAYCSDTIYDESIIPYIWEVDLLYHESTYLDDLREQALQRMHSTALEAATIASKANVKKLLIGHFSSRYLSLEPFSAEIRSIFEASYLGVEGSLHSVD